MDIMCQKGGVIIIKFDRSLITSISSRGTKGFYSNMNAKKRNIEVPTEETFRNIYSKAKDGNEFAAVLLDEWQRNCSPQNDKEKQIISLINKAANTLFK
ncbi:MAG: hypothetical protein K0R84_2212 [Clostridia bacterium]|jgi:hypothetical protein|nr:hypothetical protein [Clostridia bacterium]